MADLPALAAATCCLSCPSQGIPGSGQHRAGIAAPGPGGAEPMTGTPTPQGPGGGAGRAQASAPTELSPRRTTGREAAAAAQSLAKGSLLKTCLRLEGPVSCSHRKRKAAPLPHPQLLPASNPPRGGAGFAPRSPWHRAFDLQCLLPLPSRAPEAEARQATQKPRPAYPCAPRGQPPPTHPQSSQKALGPRLFV